MPLLTGRLDGAIMFSGCPSVCACVRASGCASVVSGQKPTRTKAHRTKAHIVKVLNNPKKCKKLFYGVNLFFSV